MRDEIQRAIGAMRTVVQGDMAAAPLGETLADIRFEAVSRGEQAGVTVRWPLPNAVPGVLSGAQRAALIGFVREAVSNVLRHAQATAVEVTLGVTPSAGGAIHLTLAITDDGSGIAADGPRVGHGLSNLATRAAELGGHCQVVPGADGRGTTVHLEARLTTPEVPA